ncbi:hypothetical protein DPMN_047232, partial [Dreissena polymorpha]
EYKQRVHFEHQRVGTSASDLQWCWQGNLWKALFVSEDRRKTRGIRNFNQSCRTRIIYKKCLTGNREIYCAQIACVPSVKCTFDETDCCFDFADTSIRGVGAVP